MTNRNQYETKVAEATEVDWARLSAFIDGEGTIAICKEKPRKATYSPRYSLSVQVTNTSPLLMVWLESVFGGHAYPVNKGKSPLSRKLVMRWYSSERQAGLILAKCLPYLIVKRAQAEVGLAFMELRSKNWSRKKVSDSTLAIRDQYRTKIQELNAGRPAMVQ